jgi:F1F0 ATPase subunit 2
MADTVALLLSLTAGLGLGLLYFGGLWLTVRQLVKARRPGWLTLASFIGRSVLTLAGFYLVMQGGWQRIVAALVGFMLMRQLLVSQMGRRGNHTNQRIES